MIIDCVGKSASDGECYQDQILKKVMKTMGQNILMS